MKNTKKYLNVIILVLVMSLLFSSFVCAKENTETTFWDYKVMSHAMGGYGDTIYSNHAMALNKTIKSGQKLIEVDAILTTDGKLVMSHGWDKYSCTYNGIKYNKNNATTMTYKKFMSIKMHGKYETMDAKQWSQYVIKHDEILWEIDLRTLTKKQATKTAKELIRTFKGHEECLDMFLIQVGSEDMYNGIHDVYPFKHYQYFIHKSELTTIDSVLKFCIDKNIESMAVNYKYMSDDIINKIKDAGLKILCYTVDDKELAQKMIDMGADTICSNFLLESDFFEDKNDDIY